MSTKLTHCLFWPYQNSRKGRDLECQQQNSLATEHCVGPHCGSLGQPLLSEWHRDEVSSPRSPGCFSSFPSHMGKNITPTRSCLLSFRNNIWSYLHHCEALKNFCWSIWVDLLSWSVSINHCLWSYSWRGSIPPQALLNIWLQGYHGTLRFPIA